MSYEEEKKSVEIMNAVEESAIAENLLNNQSCAENFCLYRYLKFFKAFLA